MNGQRGRTEWKKFLLYLRPEIKLKNQISMKKINLLIVAAVAAFATVSCEKEVKPAAPMSPEQIEQKLSDVAVATLQEADPDIWKDWGLSAINLYQDIQQVAKDSKDFEYDAEKYAVKETEEKNGNVTTITRLIQLSLLKGDITVKDGQFVLEESNNPVNLTIPSNGKTYKLQLESTGESGNGIILSERTTTVEDKTVIKRRALLVPQKIAVHVTENGKMFLEGALFPVVEDKNNNGKLDEDDAIKGSAYIQTPDYSITLNDLYVTQDSVTGSVELFHGNTSILSINAEVELEVMISNAVKALTKSETDVIPDDITGTITLMGGQAIIKADIDAGDLFNKKMSYSSEADAKVVASAFNKNAKADLYFDNNPTIQASLVFSVEEDKENECWNIIPGLHFYDGSADMTYKEFANSFMTNKEAASPLMAEFGSFMTKFNTYFGEYLPKKK